MSKKETETTYEALTKLAIETNTQRLDRLEANLKQYKKEQTYCHMMRDKEIDRLEKDLGVQKVEWLKTVDRVGKKTSFLTENYHILTKLLNKHLNKKEGEE